MEACAYSQRCRREPEVLRIFFASSVAVFRTDDIADGVSFRNLETDVPVAQGTVSRRVFVALRVSPWQNQRCTALVCVALNLADAT